MGLRSKCQKVRQGQVETGEAQRSQARYDGKTWKEFQCGMAHILKLYSDYSEKLCVQCATEPFTPTSLPQLQCLTGYTDSPTSHLSCQTQYLYCGFAVPSTLTKPHLNSLRPWVKVPALQT